MRGREDNRENCCIGTAAFFGFGLCEFAFAEVLKKAIDSTEHLCHCFFNRSAPATGIALLALALDLDADVVDGYVRVLRRSVGQPRGRCSARVERDMFD